MSFPNNNQNLRIKITDFDVASMCSSALREEHEHDTSCVKHIQAKTQVSENTISKWYRAMNAPKSAHLLILAANYPKVLRGLLFMIGREDIWRYCLLNNIPEKMVAGVDEGVEEKALYSDKFVRVDVVLNLEIAVQFNQRQLWFLGELQRGNSLQAREITRVWNRTLRTARRDIQKMVQYGAIEHCGAPKNGRYRLLE